MIDTEFLSRLHKLLNDYTQTKINSLLMTKEYGDIRHLQGAINAVSVFEEFIAEANNPSKKEEIKIAKNEYNI